MTHSVTLSDWVTLDSELTLQRHVNKVASACFLSYSSSKADLPAAWT